MRSLRARIFIVGVIFCCAYPYENFALLRNSELFEHFFQQQDTVTSDTTKNRLEEQYEPTRLPTYEQKDRFGDPFSNRLSNSPLLLQNPGSMEIDAEIDTGMNYTIYEKIGDLNYRPTTTMSFREFNQYMDRQIKKEYWKNRSAGLDGESAVSGRRLIPKLYISPVFDRIFGGSYVDITPNGFINLDAGARFQRIDNPSIPIRQQRNGGFEYDQQISMNVVGKIGEKLAITANFDNNNSFDFQNNLKVEYTGYEEDIIKKIEIGNVSMPVANSLITGGQSLFGVKAQLQFGKVFVTGIVSRQQGRNEVISVESGFQGREFDIRMSEYDENKHFFLGHFFRDNYERWLAGLPQITSGVNVTRVEVYVLNRNNDTETLRNFVGFLDLAEPRRIFNPGINPLVPPDSPNDNQANDLFDQLAGTPGIRDSDQVVGILEEDFGLENSVDFERVTAARRLDPSEYVINRELGYISMLRKLQNDEVLGVSYEYTWNGQTFRVGELNEDYANRPEDEVLVLKLLRNNQILTNLPNFDLMMKNVYNLNANQVDRDGFTLRVHYRDDRTGIDNPSLHEGAQTKDVPLLRLTGLDQLNPNNDPQPDGNFDFIEGITIDPRNGNIIFPVLEPLGERLESFFDPDTEGPLIEKFVYDTLYRTTKADAEQVASLNKYFLIGKFQAGSSSEIVLPGINISEGSVIVTAGNTPLTEGLDYTVDYNLGKVRILNEGILSSGKKIDISYEKADLFNFQTRWLSGARVDYRLDDNINFGATVLHLNERPGGISRYKIGDEPTKNTKYGFDLNFQKDSRMLTKILDALPFISTKEQSSVTIGGEFAQLIPGTSNVVDGEGTSYIDDFEAAITPFSLGGSFNAWSVGTTPAVPDNRFDLSESGAGELGKAFRRSKLAWYVIDNVFYRSGGGARPENITVEDLENHYVRPIPPQEIFRQQDRQVVNTNLPTFDIAYFPNERGQFNYNPDITEEGLVRDPSRNYGGITRAITSDVDFDKTNIEYIEFWLLDPFIGGTNGRVLDGRFNENNTTGGTLIFNLGNVSEDVHTDGRHFFENGLPADGDSINTIETPWGRTTNQQFLTEFFDNAPEARENQDLGFDGLRSNQELNFESFSDFRDAVETNVLPQFQDSIRADLSADDFTHYLDPDLTTVDAKILERYKNFNGTEGNSPVNTGEAFTTSGTNLPENEDLNNDNSVSDLESYYEYRINLAPGQLEVGTNNIVDRVTSSDGERDWYLFRIPVRSPDRIQGNIDGFKTIRYVRTYLTGWVQPTVLRMVKFQLVGAQWRQFRETLFDKGFNELPEDGIGEFETTVVNIEENSTATEDSPPYVVPPGIDRDRDNTSAIQRRTNEQSIQICVDDLEDKDARAVFKNVNYDLIQYGRVKMFFHVHSSGDVLQDDEMTAFLRLGTDFTENYYEVEVPLKVTPVSPGTIGDELRRDVWPLENEINLDLDLLEGLKVRRDRLGIPIELPFADTVFNDANNNVYRITVEGRPDLSAVQTMMIGIRNPESPDQLPRSACLWANELRVTDFNTEKGWAANARMSMKWADFMTLNASARHSTFGFGTIQQRIAERTREETTAYDISANINVDKIIPGNHGIRIPMFVSYEKNNSTPRFDPYNGDVLLDATLASFSEDEAEERDAFFNIVQDKSERKSINFINVRKDKVNPESQPHIYDIENFSFDFAYSEENRSNFNIQSQLRKSYSGGFGWNFAPKPLVFEPFKNMGAFQGKWLKLIRDFNISPIPGNFGVRWDLDRRFLRTQLFNDQLTTEGIEPFFEKSFLFNRSYNFRWNIFKSLSFDYNARANAIVDEPQEIMENGDLLTDEARRDSIWSSLKNLGRMKNFNQTFSFTYRVPLDKLPLTDWLSADLRYAGNYTWVSGSFNQIDTLGNVISNGRDRGANGKIDLVKLFNKNNYLKEINSPPRRGGRRPQASDTVRRRDSGAAKGLLRFLMMLRSVNVNYNIRETTILPGFTPTPFLFGMDRNFDAPGWGFILGSQNPDIRRDAARNGWLATSEFLTGSFVQTRTTDLNIRAQVEPFRDFKVQIDMRKSVTDRYQEIYRFSDEPPLNSGDSIINGFRSLTPSRGGSYNITFFTLRTSFEKEGPLNTSATFEQFVDNREVIRNRLETINTAVEYGDNSQDVLIPAFIAAYQGVDAATVDLNNFPRTPLPNWRLDYAGLGRIRSLSNVFSSINITHAYSSSFSITNFTNSLLYQDVQALELTNDVINYPFATETNEQGDVVPFYIMNQVVVDERWSPLIGVNVRTKDRITARAEFKKERNLVLTLSNAQVTETRSNDFSFDFGWTKSDFKLPFRVQGRTVTLNNDITFRMNFTIRNTQTVQRKIDEVNTVTRGNTNFQLRPTIAYVLNQRLNIQVYFERTVNDPLVSNSFKRSTTQFGTQVRFSLSQ